MVADKLYVTWRDQMIAKILKAILEGFALRGSIETQVNEQTEA